MVNKRLRILGIRGVPAAHGGFETFAENLALHLEQHGWEVSVYCQGVGHGAITSDDWHGIHRIHVPEANSGPWGTIRFDWRATRHAARRRELCLTLGYNTAVFCALLRLRGVPNLINMDGIEWRRAKWGLVPRVWFWLNERAGCWLGNHLIADNPEIARHLGTRVSAGKISTIAYGGDRLAASSAETVQALGLTPGGYLTLVARPEPENSVLEMVKGFSRRPRNYALVVLGNYEASNAYHRAVKQAAGPGVRFMGAIYEKPLVQSLRFHCMGYVHGHQVGGTNPSLVEALGAGNAVIAHDNAFNRWVVGNAGRFFADEAGFAAVLDSLEQVPEQWDVMRLASRARFETAFTWPSILSDYEALLTRFLPEE